MGEPPDDDTAANTTVANTTVAKNAVATSFRKSPADYDRHIGRYGTELACGLIALAGVAAGDRVIDVGCGTGLLTAEIATRVFAGPGSEGALAAVDPSEPFVAACRSRVPRADVRVGIAEHLPFTDDGFDAALSQLVLNFIGDPEAGAREMCRVTRPRGIVAASVWDYADQMTLLRAFWDAARIVDPASARQDEGVTMLLCDPAALATLWAGAGLRDVEVTALRPTVRYADFDDLWQPFLAGVGPSGAHAASLADQGREALRSEFFRLLGCPTGPFELTARAWAVVGRR